MKGIWRRIIIHRNELKDVVGFRDETMWGYVRDSVTGGTKWTSRVAGSKISWWRTPGRNQVIHFSLAPIRLSVLLLRELPSWNLQAFWQLLLLVLWQRLKSLGKNYIFCLLLYILEVWRHQSTWVETKKVYRPQHKVWKWLCWSLLKYGTNSCTRSAKFVFVSFGLC